MEYGIQKGDVCGRNGCTGIIEEHPRVGECACHIIQPCAYCSTPVEFCPECGWDAAEELEEQLSREVAVSAHRSYKTPEMVYNELPDGEFGYVYSHIDRTFVEVKGKHNGLSRKEILKRLGCDYEYCMPKFKLFTSSEFVVSYFTD